jgi:hypothetical protein
MITMVVAIVVVGLFTGCPQPTLDPTPEPEPQKVAAVVFSPGDGSYNLLEVDVELSTTTDGATVYYSTDASEPSIEYTGPVNITSSTLFRAVAKKAGWEDSDETSANINLNTPLINDDFSSSNGDWVPSSPTAGNWSLVSGQYQVDTNVASCERYMTAFNNSGIAYTNFDISLDITNVVAGRDRNNRGLIFRDIGSGSYYFFYYKPDGRFGVELWSSGSKSDLISSTNSTEINTGNGATNTLRVVAIGTNFTFYINGTEVGSTTDSSYASGAFRLFAENKVDSGAGADVVSFDNILAW